MQCGNIIVISGPSGAGKSSLLDQTLRRREDCFFSISTTTRPIREGEVDGKDYYFVSRDQFEEDIDHKRFVEYARVHENYYGTSTAPVNAALDKGKIVVFDIDVQGNESIKNKFPKITTSIFLLPPSLSELESRLRARDTDSEAVIQKRIQNAKDEINAIDAYDYIIINDDLDLAIKEFDSIISSLNNRTFCMNKDAFIANWLK
jgi:guanylate kinase